MKAFFLSHFVLLVAVPIGAQLPVCEICGCSYCPPEDFAVGNPDGVIPIPPQFLDISPPGFTNVSCGYLEFGGLSGMIAADLCSDELRLDPTLRTNCGCPPLPSATTTAAPTVWRCRNVDAPAGNTTSNPSNVGGHSANHFRGVVHFRILALVH
jgi:hypothetical protein